MSILNKRWSIKHRPTKIEDYVGNPDFIEKLKFWLSNGDVPHILLHSQSGGTGKTTAAWIIVKQLNASVLYINASKDNGIDIIRDKIVPFVNTIGFNEKKVIILDESDYLTPNFQAALRPILEEPQSEVIFILTANQVEKIISPIRDSRCVSFEINTPPKKDVLLRLETILKLENVEFNRNVVKDVVNNLYPDQRAMINHLQDNSITGTYIVPKKTESNLVSDQIIELLTSKVSAKDVFTKVRELISEHKIRHFQPFFRKLYDDIELYAKSGTVGLIIPSIADAQFRDSQVPDKEINFMSLIVNILNIVK